ncbi:DUF6491 family protein [Pseudomonas oryzihabitans]|uniref:Lipoprotein n=1 Tax=Pseudomonas oryzihabitans TaxID=47885 RepID=A0AAJ2EUZ5_9PSED|nr:DUF6491 family protein [Pseudomonas psychrotolerans]MDR6233142.1 hypothetical protein [Pseudomonas psychrotolerans]MDR6357867.1 hypothetical protein [Pseudomonas psychrotolerans]
MRVRSTALLLAAAVLLAGCAARPFGPPTLDDRLAELGYRQGAPVDTILGFDLSGWHYLDSRHLALGTGLGRAYLVDFVVPCRNLAAGNRLGYRSRAAGLRPGDFLVSTDARGSRLDCPIGGLYRLDPLR